MQWQLFATLHSNIAPPMLDATGAMIGILTNWIGPIIRDGAILFIVLKLLGGA